MRCGSGAQFSWLHFKLEIQAVFVMFACLQSSTSFLEPSKDIQSVSFLISQKLSIWQTSGSPAFCDHHVFSTDDDFQNYLCAGWMHSQSSVANCMWDDTCYSHIARPNLSFLDQGIWESLQKIHSLGEVFGFLEPAYVVVSSARLWKKPGRPQLFQRQLPQ